MAGGLFWTTTLMLLSFILNSNKKRTWCRGCQGLGFPPLYQSQKVLPAPLKVFVPELPPNIGVLSLAAAACPRRLRQRLFIHPNRTRHVHQNGYNRFHFGLTKVVAVKLSRVTTWRIKIFHGAMVTLWREPGLTLPAVSGQP